MAEEEVCAAILTVLEDDTSKFCNGVSIRAPLLLDKLYGIDRFDDKVFLAYSFR